MLFIVFGAIILVVRSAVSIYKRTTLSSAKFPVFSISMLSVSLILLIAGIAVSLQISDALGSAIGSLGGFFGLLESNIRHKREALLDKEATKESLPQN